MRIIPCKFLIENISAGKSEKEYVFFFFNVGFFYFCILSVFVLIGLLLLSFSVVNLLSFYILFEFSLIPILYLVISWGYQVERITASYYLFVYTLIGSFPLFLSLLFVYFDFSLN